MEAVSDLQSALTALIGPSVISEEFYCRRNDVTILLSAVTLQTGYEHECENNNSVDEYGSGKDSMWVGAGNGRNQ